MSHKLQVTGSIRIIGTQLLAVFVIGGDSHYRFHATLTTPAKDIYSQEIVLHYNDTHELAGTCVFTGPLGTKDVSLQLINDPIMIGPLEKPINTRMKISGSGNWTVTRDVDV